MHSKGIPLFSPFPWAIYNSNNEQSHKAVSHWHQTILWDFRAWFSSYCQALGFVHLPSPGDLGNVWDHIPITGFEQYSFIKMNHRRRAWSRLILVALFALSHWWNKVELLMEARDEVVFLSCFTSENSVACQMIGYYCTIIITYWLALKYRVGPTLIVVISLVLFIWLFNSQKHTNRDVYSNPELENLKLKIRS